MATLKQVARVMGSLAVFFPHYKLNRDTVRAYARILKSIPDDVLDAAAMQVVSESEFYPSVAALRKASIDIMQAAQAIPDASEAWQIVCWQIRRYGHIQAPEWTHEVVADAVKAVGGFGALCMSDNQVADRARFLNAYESVLRRYRNRVISPLPEVESIVKKLAAGMRPQYLESGENE